jgi:hypothetical protein
MHYQGFRLHPIPETERQMNKGMVSVSGLNGGMSALRRT